MGLGTRVQLFVRASQPRQGARGGLIVPTGHVFSVLWHHEGRGCVLGHLPAVQAVCRRVFARLACWLGLSMLNRGIHSGCRVLAGVRRLLPPRIVFASVARAGRGHPGCGAARDAVCCDFFGLQARMGGPAPWPRLACEQSFGANRHYQAGVALADAGSSSVSVALPCRAVGRDWTQRDLALSLVATPHADNWWPPHPPWRAYGPTASPGMHTAPAQHASMPGAADQSAPHVLRHFMEVPCSTLH